MKRVFILILTIGMMISLIACGNKGSQEEKIPEESILTFHGEENSGIFYFYGVIKSEDTYYVRVLSEYQSEPLEEEFRYVPLADEIYSYFQPNGWEGAWSPIDYYTAQDLAEAHQEEQITIGAEFSYGITDGRMDFLTEVNYYEGFDVTIGEEYED